MLVTAAFLLINAIWIPVKAELAQLLMEDAWRRTLEGETNAKPWPWADTSPVALLEVPEHGLRMMVLAGTSGRNLAFGPTFLGAPELADKILSGHRDTHFYFLESIKVNDLLRFTTVHGTFDYRVTWLEIIDSRLQKLVLEPGVERLTLITCYPFNSLTSGGPLRYVVTALPVIPLPRPRVTK